MEVPLDKRDERNRQVFESRKEEIVNAEVLEDYGPWMLVRKKSRKEDRQSDLRNGKSTLHENGKLSLQRKGDINGGSFTVLADEDEKQLGDGPVQEVGASSSKDAVSEKVGQLSGRSRRPSVQITKKEVENKQGTTLGNKGQHKYDDGWKKLGKSLHKSNNVGILRQAAAKSKHTLVRGTQGGKNITREVIQNDPPFMGFTLVDNEAFEHHNDPSENEMLDHDDTLMNEENGGDFGEGGSDRNC
ncbi:hypothetical protein DITRI_Ditri03aG0067300 [Diplodiscus trichospermus]